MIVFATVGALMAVLAVLTVRRWVTATVGDLAAAAVLGVLSGIVVDTRDSASPWAILGFCAWSVAVSRVDIDRRRLPDDLTLTGAVAVLLAASFDGMALPVLAGGLALAGVHLVGAVLVPGSIGGGDVKLCLALGGVAAMSGGTTWFVAAAAAPVFTLMLAPVAKRHGGVGAIAHGPALCAATLVAWVAVGT